MIELKSPHRTATAEDAPVMAKLINMAGDGLPLYLWERMAEYGQTGWDIGCERARRTEGSFSWCNTVLREENGRVSAGLVGYPRPREPEAVNYEEMPAMFVPLQQLEDLAPGTWYINAIAGFPEDRGKGYGSELMAIAEKLARQTQRKGLSLVVSNANKGARNFYQRHGFHEVARRPMVKEDWENPGTEWVLMVKSLMDSFLNLIPAGR